MAVQSVGLASAGNGVALTAGAAGSATAPILLLKCLVAGPGISLTAGTSGVDVIIAATGFPKVVSTINVTTTWGATIGQTCVFTAAFPVQVTAIVGRNEIANASLGGIMPLKILSGGSIAQGINLATASLNVVAPINVTQVLPLVADYTVLSLASGDSLAVVANTVMTTGVGSMTIFLAPL
jgi:hypothetical protein